VLRRLFFYWQNDLTVSCLSDPALQRIIGVSSESIGMVPLCYPLGPVTPVVPAMINTKRSANVRGTA
jgi:hypothetical protein